MDALDPLHIAVLLVSGLAAGFINTLAGGGSLLTLPVLLLVGLPADMANATNRVCVFAQSFSGAMGFDKKGKLDRKAVVVVALPTLAGAAAGAWAASVIPSDVFKPILIGTLMLVAVTLVWKPAALAPVEGSEPRKISESAWGIPGLFLIGAYGGFLQAGVGIFLLLFLGGALRYDLVRGNALKVVVICAFTVVSLVVFAIAGKIVWVPGLVLAVGTIVGAQLAVRFAIEQGTGALRKVVFATVVASCIAAIWR